MHFPTNRPSFIPTISRFSHPPRRPWPRQTLQNWILSLGGRVGSSPNWFHDPIRRAPSENTTTESSVRGLKGLEIKADRQTALSLLFTESSRHWMRYHDQAARKILIGISTVYQKTLWYSECAFLCQLERCGISISFLFLSFFLAFSPRFSLDWRGSFRCDVSALEVLLACVKILWCGGGLGRTTRLQTLHCWRAISSGPLPFLDVNVFIEFTEYLWAFIERYKYFLYVVEDKLDWRFCGQPTSGILSTLPQRWLNCVRSFPYTAT